MGLGYRPALSGIRGIAILLVTVGHFTGWPPGGAQGVDLFFALSGFLITSLLLEERDRTGAISLRRFYIRRARRLFPALAAMLAVYAAVAPHPTVPVTAAALYVTNFIVASGGGAPALSHLWSLAEEEQFYLVWPVVLALLLRVSRRLVVPLLLASLVILDIERARMTGSGVSPVVLQFFPLTRLDGIMLGCMAAVALHRGWIPLRAAKVALLSAVPFALVCALTVGPTSRALHEYLLPLLALSFTLMVVVAATDEGRYARALGFAPLVFLGEISYALYLWQIPVLYAFHAHLGLRWPGSLIALAATVAVASASTYWWEPRFRVKRAAQPRYQPAPSSAA